MLSSIICNCKVARHSTLKLQLVIQIACAQLSVSVSTSTPPRPYNVHNAPLHSTPRRIAAGGRPCPLYALPHASSELGAPHKKARLPPPTAMASATRAVSDLSRRSGHLLLFVLAHYGHAWAVPLPTKPSGTKENCCPSLLLSQCNLCRA